MLHPMLIGIQEKRTRAFLTLKTTLKYLKALQMKGLDSMSDTILRQANNKVECVGLLKAKELKYSDNNERIYGYVVISTDQGSDHSISISASRTKKDGSLAKSYPNIAAFMANAVSIAELLKQGKSKEEAEAACSRVAVSQCQLEVNDYCDRTGQLTSRQQVRAGFLTQLDPIKPFHPVAAFDVECFIDAISMETKDGESTGRLKVKAWIPGNSGRIIPFDFFVDASIADDFISVYTPKSSGNLWGQMVNTVNVTVTHKQGIGSAKEERTTNAVHEFVVTGASEPYEEDSTKAFPLEAVQKAVQVRINETLPQIEANFKTKQQKATAAGSFNRPATAPANPVENFQV